MPTFLTGNELNNEVEKILRDAKYTLILVSPYIKLHENYKRALHTQRDNNKLKITLVFGKNEQDPSKSVKPEELEFFKEFPNIEIKYEKRLHAKYYANDDSAILTSMNLYDYSQDNNIEAGVKTKTTILGSIGNNIISRITDEESFDKKTENYFAEVIEHAKTIFKQSTTIDTGFLGLIRTGKDTIVEIDNLADFFSGYRQKTVHAFIPQQNNTFKQKVQQGYCIRTGVAIPFNLERPFTNDAFNSWNKYRDANYKEKYCHFSGEKSNGKTSFSKPILYENLKKAKEVFGF